MPACNTSRGHRTFTSPCRRRWIGLSKSVVQREKSTFIPRKEADVKITPEGARVTVKDPGAEAEKRMRQQLDAQNAYLKLDPRRMISWYLALSGRDYESGKSEMLGIVRFRAPWGTIFNAYMVLGDGLSKALLIMFYVLIGLFVVVEFLSLVIGGHDQPA